MPDIDARFTTESALLREPCATRVYVGEPEIHHSDRGVHYAADDYVGRLRGGDCRISMAEAGQMEQGGFAERLMRTIEEEEVDLSDHQDLGMPCGIRARSRMTCTTSRGCTRRRVARHLRSPSKSGGRSSEPESADGFGGRRQSARPVLLCSPTPDLRRG